MVPDLVPFGGMYPIMLDVQSFEQGKIAGDHAVVAG